MIAATWLRRACTAEDVAEARLYLCSGASSVTAHSLVIDGGRAL